MKFAIGLASLPIAFVWCCIGLPFWVTFVGVCVFGLFFSWCEDDS